MALTIATGFVVDDAIVVMENIARHMEEGMPRLQAAFRGAREVGFTVLSISLSLIMVFLPILLMGGILGRLFREFTVTLSIAILVSLVISLTTTPMLCALFLKTDRARGPEGRPSLFERLRIGYGHTLTWALRHSLLILVDLHRHGRPEHLSVLSPRRRAFFRNRTPAASSARCRPTKASRSSR